MKAIDAYLHHLASQFLNQTMLASRRAHWRQVQHLMRRRTSMVARLEAYYRGLSVEKPQDLLADLAALMSEYMIILRRHNMA